MKTYKIKLGQWVRAWNIATNECLDIGKDLWTSVKVADHCDIATIRAMATDNFKKRLCYLNYGNCFFWKNIAFDETMVEIY